MLRNIALLLTVVLVCVALWATSEEPPKSNDGVIVITPTPEPVATQTPMVVAALASPKTVNPDQLELEESVVDDDKDTVAVNKGKAATPAKVIGVINSQRGVARPIRTSRSVPVLEEDDARGIFSSLDEDAVVAQPEPRSDLITGIPSGIFGNGATAAEPTPLPTPTVVEKKVTEQLPWVRGQARGYAMLYALHPRARALVEQQVRTLIQARIRQPYVGILIDGTFTQNFDVIKSMINRLSADGRELTLALYIANGATMRKWDSTPIDALFTKFEPTYFRSMIMYDETTRARYTQALRQAKDLFLTNIQGHPLNKNVAIIMLEDNLDHASYRAMRDMAGQQLGDLVTYVRNPCAGCYEGNDADPQGDSREEHRTEYFDSLARGDEFTLDGEGFRYPDGSGSSSGMSSDELLGLIERGFTRGLRYFGLWRHGWQGVVEGVANVHPDERFYQTSNAAQLEFEVTALRHGLDLEPAE